MHKYKQKQKSGFTIVELLVVIVVIGILAAITIVAFTGVSQKAVAASLQSDLGGASTKLMMYQVEHGSYPTGMSAPAADGTICPSAPVVDERYCIKPSPGNNFTYTGATSTFVLDNTRTDSNTTYRITESRSSIPVNILAWTQIVTGQDHNCAIASNNQAYCWGLNNTGQLGNNSTVNSSVPVAVNTSGVLSGKTIKAIASGQLHTCVIASNDQAYCWGRNLEGELGNGTGIDSLVPVAVNTSGVLSGKTVKAIASHGQHTCAIASDNMAYCWGYNSDGQLGNNSTTNSLVPIAVNNTGVLNGKTIKYISTALYHSCAIASDDQAYCWGVNSVGQLGNNSTTRSLVPVAVYVGGAISGMTVKYIDINYHFGCMIASDNQAYCWGQNSSGQLGNNSTTNSSVPVAVNVGGVLSGKTIKSIASGSYHTCIVASDNQSYCWGDNYDGALGNNSTTRSLVPTAVYTSGNLSGKTIKLVTAGSFYSCAIASDNQAYCWGRNDYGTLGNNSNIRLLTPTSVNPLVIEL